LKRLVFPLLLVSLLLPRVASGADGFLYFEGTAATVNKEVLFFSDIFFEQCLLLCGVLPEGQAEELSLTDIRARLIADMLAFQEQKKLVLGHVDNVMLAEQVREAMAKIALCESPCRHDISVERIAKRVERRLVILDFLHGRVEIFVDVKEEDIRKELERRAEQKEPMASLSAEEVRREILEEKIAKEVRNWHMRAASKATITLSPLEGK